MLRHSPPPNAVARSAISLLYTLRPALRPRSTLTPLCPNRPPVPSRCSATRRAAAHAALPAHRSAFGHCRAVHVLFPQRRSAHTPPCSHMPHRFAARLRGAPLPHTLGCPAAPLLGLPTGRLRGFVAPTLGYWPLGNTVAWSSRLVPVCSAAQLLGCPVARLLGLRALLCCFACFGCSATHDGTAPLPRPAARLARSLARRLSGSSAAPQVGCLAVWPFGCSDSRLCSCAAWLLGCFG